MNAAWIVNGWRQQYRSLSVTMKAVGSARDRGMQSYVISRQGRYFWLLCSREIGFAYDAASAVRHFYKATECGVYVGLWREQWVIIAWHGDKLQHCLAGTVDAEGFAHATLLLEQLSRKGKRRTAIFLAKSVSSELQNYCQEHMAHWQRYDDQVDLAELPQQKHAQLRDMATPTPWQQRQRLIRICFLVVSVAVFITWYVWPASKGLEQSSSASVQPVLAPPNGLAPRGLADLPDLFFGLEHLAGWQLRTAQLQGQQMTVSLTPTYGRVEELATQVHRDWQIQAGKESVQLHHAWPRVSYQQHQGGEAIAPLAPAVWQQNLQLHFPDLTFKDIGRKKSDGYLQQTFQLDFAQTNWQALAVLAALLDHPHLRIVSLQLDIARTLRVELHVRWYQPQPLAKEGEAG